MTVERVTEEEIAVPMVHMNGTSKKELQEQFREAHSALSKALRVVTLTAPHARDYYPCKDYPEVFTRARAQYKDRLDRITRLCDEMTALWLAVGEQGKK